MLNCSSLVKGSISEFKEDQKYLPSTCNDQVIGLIENLDTRSFSLSCPVCGSVMSGLDSLKNHFHNMQCTECEFFCESILEMSNHVNGIHGGSELFCSGTNLCQECNLQTNSAYLMMVHLFQVHPDRCTHDSLLQCVCMECISEGNEVTVCGSKKDLLLHVNTAHRVANDNTDSVEEELCYLGCKLCGKNCSSEQALRFHMSLKHQVSLNQLNRNNSMNSVSKACPICGQAFKTYSTLHSHLNELHLDDEMPTNVNVHQCDLCPMRYVTERALRQHKNRKHRDPDLEQVECPAPSCTHRVSTAGQLQRHLNQAHPELAAPEGVECPRCHRRFCHQLSLAMHNCESSGPALRRAETDAAKCDECGRTFRSELALATHVKHKHRGVPRPAVRQLFCPVESCDAVFTIPKLLDHHVRTAHKQVAGILLKYCPQEGCDQSFTSERSLVLHLAKSHKPEKMQPVGRGYKRSKSAVCPVVGCQEGFPDEAAVGRHLRSQHPDFMPPGYVQCPECKLYFPSERSLNMHVGKSHDQEHNAPAPRRTHLAKSQVVCPADGCDMRMCSSMLLFHINKYHSPEQIPDCVKCQDCGMLLIGEKGLWLHVIKKHRGERAAQLSKYPYVCPVTDCGRALRRKRELELHLRNKHPNFTVSGDVTCEHCGLRFATDRARRMHIIKMHNEQLPLKCPQDGCDRRFYGGSWLNRHLELAHLLQYSRRCIPCDKRLITEERYIEHIERCRGKIKTIVSHLCGKCKEKFSSESERDEHVNSCQKESLLRCEECNISFASAANLSVHNRTLHANKWKFQCQACSLGFQNALRFANHCESVHQFVPEGLSFKRSRPVTSHSAAQSRYTQEHTSYHHGYQEARRPASVRVESSWSTPAAVSGGSRRKKPHLQRREESAEEEHLNLEVVQVDDIHLQDTVSVCVLVQHDI